MNRPADQLSAARKRICLAYDPTLLRASGTRLVEQLASHLASVEASAGSVLNWTSPNENLAQARQIADEWDGSATQEMLASRFEALVQKMLSRGHNLHDPRYVGHQVPASIPLAGLFDAVGSVTNQVMAVYEMGPWATAVEQAMVHKLAGYLGWPEGAYAGVVTHGGTLANLNALLVARNVALGGCWEEGLDARKPVIVAQADAHYCIARAAGILGLGTKHVVKVGLDQRRRMDVNQLDKTLRESKSQGHPIIAVVACACSTPVGAFDPLDAIADVCQRHHVWLHVDAAHGGSALLSQRHRHLVAGLERADSIVWDAHKMMFVPALLRLPVLQGSSAQLRGISPERAVSIRPQLAGPRRVRPRSAHV